MKGSIVVAVAAEIEGAIKATNPDLTGGGLEALCMGLMFKSTLSKAYAWHLGFLSRCQFGCFGLRHMGFLIGASIGVLGIGIGFTFPIFATF